LMGLPRLWKCVEKWGEWGETVRGERWVVSRKAEASAVKVCADGPIQVSGPYRSLTRICGKSQ
jgi:hypothetical protein